MATNRAVRLNIYMPRDSMDRLKRIQQLTGKRSGAEVVRSAVRLYRLLVEAEQDDKTVLLIDRESKEETRLVLT